MVVIYNKLIHSYILELEERNAALEAELLRLKDEAKGRLQQGPTTVDPVTDLPHFESFVLDQNFDAYAEQIAKLLVDPSGHARKNTHFVAEVRLHWGFGGRRVHRSYSGLRKGLALS